MSLLVAYVVILVIAQSITIALGLMIDRLHSPNVGLMASIALYFMMFWVAWRIALWITKPRVAAKPVE